MKQKLKRFLTNDTYFIAILLIFIGVISFGLGRLSALESQNKPEINAKLTALPSIKTENKGYVDSRPVVASKTGTKYHLLDCPGAEQMKAENRIEFATAGHARAAGYTPAGNCPGLQ